VEFVAAHLVVFRGNKNQFFRKFLWLCCRYLA